MTEDEMTDIGAKVYRLCLNSAASHGDTDTDLEWIHTGEEVVRHSDYEIALKRILELEEQVRVRGERMETLWSNVYVAIMSQDSYDNISKWFDDNGKVRDERN